MSPENLLKLMFIMKGLTIMIMKILYSRTREGIIMTLLIVGSRMDPTLREIALQLITDRKIDNSKDQDSIPITMRTTHHLIRSQRKITST